MAKMNYEEISKKFVLSFDEAKSYFRIGEKRLRTLMDESPNADWILYVGNRRYIKRQLFEDFINHAKAI